MQGMIGRANMGEQLFSFDRRNFRECQSKFRGDREQEYYQGDFWIADAPRIEVRSERKLVGPISIIRQRSATNLFFRRSRQHIREDATDLSILWFVKKGQIAFSNQFGSKIVLPGHFAITRSTQPFFMECQVDGNAEHEVLHVTVPTYVLQKHVPCDSGAGLFLQAMRAELVMAENILTHVFENDGALNDAAARLLVDAALALAGTAIRSEEIMPVRQTLSERRQQDLLRFIEVHLSNPHLSPVMAAKGCGISQRYLSTLMQRKGTSFSELVWTQRLDRAKLLLASTELRTSSIAEIAFSLGFKSSAHFSRMFKRAFDINPRDFRLESYNEDSMDPIVPTQLGSELLQ
jgi:AraC-like DNA-binding protein